VNDPHEFIPDLAQSDGQRHGRYYGFVSGSITNVKDPNGLIQVKARMEGQGDNDETDWLIPMLPGSMEALPNKGDPCIIGFIDGDPHRGFWTYHPKTTTNNRPTEAMALGTTTWGMINFLVDQVNQLRSDFNTFASTYTSHVHPFSGAVSGVTCSGTTTATPSTQPSTAALAANKGQASDGSTIPNVSTAKKVTSGYIKLR
jgi:hypothetical protein